jgi:hypothetical protein
MNRTTSVRRSASSRPSSGFVSLLAAIALIAGTAGTVEGQVRWRSGVSAPVVADRAALETALDDFALRSAQRHIVLELNGSLSPADREALRASGVEVLSYLGDNAFFAVIEPATLDARAASQVGNLKSVQAIQPAWKAHPDVLANDVPRWVRVGETIDEQGATPFVALYVVLHRDIDARTQGAAVAQRHGAVVRSVVHSINMLVVELPEANVSAMIEDDAVQWVEWPLPPLDLFFFNDMNRLLTEADEVQAPPYELDGEGVVVLVYDGGSARPTHVDFGGRLTVHDESPRHDHPTHVAGTIGGDGTASGGLRRGMAPGTRLLSYGFETPPGESSGFLYTNPGDIEADLTDAIVVNEAVISNASIGTNVAANNFPCTWEGDYSAVSVLIDAIVTGSLGEHFRMVWAGGNERGNGRCGTLYGTVAPPSPAKNHIAVGALNSNDDSMTDFSSWGPTDDGRIKPDVCAPGCQDGSDNGVTSTSNSGDATYRVFCGTSMAAPTVTGVSALLIQDWRTQFPNLDDPRNATIKVLLAHNAEDIEEPGPDFKSGYGSVRIRRTIDFMRQQNFFEDSVAHGETYIARVLVTPEDEELKVTVAWDDHPGTPNVAPNLVNDLDLVVRHENGTVYYPWTLDAENPATHAVRTQADRLNNMEQVVIDQPEPGIYLVEIQGYNVPEGPQDFSVAGSPILVNCSEAGKLALSQPKYACEDTVEVELVDCHLNVDDFVIDSAYMILASTSEPGGELVEVSETGSLTARFVGSLPISSSGNQPGVLHVAPGDILYAAYFDINDGQGQQAIIVDTGWVDCAPPALSNIEVTATGPFDNPFQAVVNVAMDEPAIVTVRYGQSCDALTGVTPTDKFFAAHAVLLTELEHNTTYDFVVDAVDEVGNGTTFHNDGQCYFFTTTDIPDYLTEDFDANMDLGGTSLLFTPNGSFAHYDLCMETIDALPISPDIGTVMPLSDNSSQLVTLADGALVNLYGVEYGSFYVGSNGYLTFGSADFSSTPTIASHFSKARVAALFDDLNPSGGGVVRRAQLGDRAVVTFIDVPRYPTAGSNTFQVEMFYDGRIRISYLGITDQDAIVGMSRGDGIPPYFYNTDLTEEGVCEPRIDILPTGALPGSIPPAAPFSFDVRILSVDGDYIPGTATLHYRTSDALPFSTTPLAALGGDLFRATLPPVSCAASPEFYISAQGAISGPSSYPFGDGAAVLAVAVSEQSQVDILAADFETGLPAGWVVSGLWQATSECPIEPVCDGAAWAYYGQSPACNYVTGTTRNMGALTAPVLAVPSSTQVTLTYCSSLRTENFPTADRARVFAGTAVIDTPSGAAAGLPWATRTVNLTGYAGQNITLRWDFDTVDGNNNNFHGWQVDDIRVTALLQACTRTFTLERMETIGACLNGPDELTPPEGCTPEDFDASDLDRDGDVDMQDIWVFQLVFDGAGG